MNNIDYTQAYITLSDGSEWQVLGEDGSMDPVATQEAIEAYLTSLK